MFETTSLGAVLPSYDIETRVESDEQLRATEFWVTVALGMCAGFVALEMLEMAKTGLSYFTDPWNLMDAVNFGIFFLTWLTLQRSFTLGAEREGALQRQPRQEEDAKVDRIHQVPRVGEI